MQLFCPIWTLCQHLREPGHISGNRLKSVRQQHRTDRAEVTHGDGHVCVHSRHVNHPSNMPAARLKLREGTESEENTHSEGLNGEWWHAKMLYPKPSHQILHETYINSLKPAQDWAATQVDDPPPRSARSCWKRGINSEWTFHFVLHDEHTCILCGFVFEFNTILVFSTDACFCSVVQSHNWEGGGGVTQSIVDSIQPAFHHLHSHWSATKQLQALHKA